MTNINVRVIGTANMKAMTGPFAQLEAQVAALNEQLATMVKLQNGVDPKGYQRMAQAAKLNARTFANAAASTGMFEVQQLRVNKATDDFVSKLQKQRVSFGDMLRQQKLVSAAYREQIKLQNMVATTMRTSNVHGKQEVTATTPNLIPEKELSSWSNKMKYANTLLASGATQMVNWGKNTQWAGRQLSMGFTMPLAALGAAAGVMAYQVDKSLTQVQKVYNTTAQSGIAQQRELDQVREAGMKTAMQAAQQYGSAATDTLNVQAQLAASGKAGNELQKDTIEVMRISRLGDLDYNDAIKATISLQSVFGMSAKKLGDSFNYINDVENATSLQTQDFAKAIPIAAAPVKAFGGNIQELGTLLVAMKQNGIEATQGANAIKAAMQRLGRPSQQVQEEWKALTGTDITKIFDESKDLIDLFTRIGDATKNLAPKDQIRAFAGLFGTYQVTRMMAMVKGMEDLKNGVGQVSTAAKIASQDTTQWSKVANQEITRYQESLSGKWDRAIQDMKLQLSTLGEPFVTVATNIIGDVSKIIKWFNKLPSAAKTFIAFPAVVTAIAGPLTMLTGLFVNLGGTGLKAISGLLPKMELFTTQQKAAALAAEEDAAAMADERSSVELLTAALTKLSAARAIADEETKKFRLDTLMAAGMTETAAKAQIQNEDTQMMTAMGSIGQTSKQTETSFGKISKYAKISAVSIGISAAAMAAMTISSNKTVDKISEMVMMVGMLGPLLIPVGSKFVSSFASATKAATAAAAEARAVNGAMTGAQAGAAAFAGEMSMASLASAGILAAVVAIGAAWYFSKKHTDAIAAQQKAILDKQVNANKALVTTSAHFAENLGKAAGAYDAIISGAGTGGPTSMSGVPGSSTTYKAFKYFTTNSQGQADAKNLKTSFDDTDAYMSKLRQQYLDLMKIGKLSAKQAMETIQGELIAVGKSGQEAAATAQSVAAAVGNLKNTDWTQNISNSLKVVQSELAKTSKAAGMGNNISYTPYYSVDWNKETEDYKKGLAGIQGQLERFAGIFNTAWNNAMNPEQARKAIKAVTDAAMQQFNSAYSKMMSNPAMAAMLQGKGIKNAQQLQEAYDQGNISYKDLQRSAGKVGSANYIDPQAMKAALDQAKAFEQALIGAVSKSNELDDSVKTVAGFIAAMSTNAQQMNFKQAKASAMDLYQSVVRAQGILDTERANNKGGTNQVGVDAAKSSLAAAKNTAQYNLSLIAAAKNIKVGATAAQTLYNIMHHVSAEAENAGKHAKELSTYVDGLPTQMSITLSAKESIQVVHDAMAATEDDMVQSAQDKFNADWDKRMAARQTMWSNRETALQNRQQDAQDAMDKRFQKAQDDINKRYDERIAKVNKEIKAEQDADAKRQKMYENEKKRMQDLADMANKNIDFNTALNEGNFDEAAKIRNDMDAQKGANSLDAIESRRSARVQKVVDRLQKKIDNLGKSRDKELKRLQNVEDAQKKSLQRMQAAQSAALKKREDADMASQQKTRDYEQAMLNQRLDLFKTYVAKNQKDLEAWMKKVGLTYDDFGSDIKAKGESWASFFQKALHQHIIAGASQITNDDMWSKITPKLAGKLLKGLGFASLTAFQRFVNTGRMKTEQRGGGPGVEHATGGHSTRHGGGMVGSLFGKDNRKGLRGQHGGLHRSEMDIRAQRGEFLVNQKATRENRGLLERINRGGNIPERGGGVLPVSGMVTGVTMDKWAAGLGKGMNIGKKIMMSNIAKSKSKGGTSTGPGAVPYAGPIGGTNAIGRKAIQWAADRIGAAGWFYQCLKFVRTALGAPSGADNAAHGWDQARYKHGIKSMTKVPAGVPVWWHGGSGGDGHVALSTGGGHLISTDYPTIGRVGTGTIAGITNGWGEQLMGWSEDINGKRIWDAAWLRDGGTVKFDNTPAILHHGETVLTDSLTKKFKDNVASGGNITYDVDVSVSGSDIDPNDIADAVIKKIGRREARKPQSRRSAT